MAVVRVHTLLLLKTMSMEFHCMDIKQERFQDWSLPGLKHMGVMERYRSLSYWPRQLILRKTVSLQVLVSFEKWKHILPRIPILNYLQDWELRAR